MSKLLITLGLVILLVTPYYAEDSFEDEDEESEEQEEESSSGGSEESGKEGGEEGEEEYIAKGEFVETDGKKKHCDSHEACYDQREPQSWCLLKEDQSWTDKGCFCDRKRHSCVIERKSGYKYEYAYCAPQDGWQCSYD